MQILLFAFILAFIAVVQSYPSVNPLSTVVDNGDILLRLKRHPHHGRRRNWGGGGGGGVYGAPYGGGYSAPYGGAYGAPYGGGYGAPYGGGYGAPYGGGGGYPERYAPPSGGSSQAAASSNVVSGPAGAQGTSSATATSSYNVGYPYAAINILRWKAESVYMAKICRLDLRLSMNCSPTNYSPKSKQLLLCMHKCPHYS